MSFEFTVRGTVDCPSPINEPPIWNGGTVVVTVVEHEGKFYYENFLSFECTVSGRLSTELQ